MSFMSNMRLTILIVLVLISALLILSPYIFKQKGVEVSFVENGTTCVSQGDILTGLEGLQIQNANQFQSLVQNVTQNSTISLTDNGNSVACTAIANGDLGFLVKDISSSNLKFGIDISGGTSVLLQPVNATADPNVIAETITTLNDRINFYGLKDIRVSAIGSNLIQIQEAGATGNDISNFLAKQGKFEGKLLYQIQVSNNAVPFTIGNNKFSFGVTNSSIIINGTAVQPGQNFVLDGFNFQFLNTTNFTAFIYGDVLQGSDIVTVLNSAQYSSIQQVQGGWQFTFSIQLTQTAAQRFATLTSNQPTVYIGGQSYITPQLVLLLDNQIISQLNIASNIAGQVTTVASIQGVQQTQNDALTESLRLQSTLRSGSLPVQLEIVKVDTITQTAGQQLINSTFVVAIAAAISVSIIIMIRYRKIKIAIPMILTSFSEVTIVLGFYALTQVLSGGNGWDIDIPAVAGLIALIGVGVNQLIIITDQMLLESEQTVKYRYKTAMNMIYNSAAIVITAMIPLIVLGLGTLRGFAITTILGVLIGIFITRPAYTAILERLEKLV